MTEVDELRKQLEDLAQRVARLEERLGPEPDPLVAQTMLYREGQKAKASATKGRM